MNPRKKGYLRFLIRRLRIISKYVDVPAILQVIGSVYNNPELLDLTDKYALSDDDFPEQFHKIVFGSIFKIHELGVNKITLNVINDFLQSRPKSEAIFKQQKGEEWLLKVAEAATPNTFDYYYNRVKKFTLLRAFDDCGIDIKDIYDPDDILDTKKRQRQEELLDNSSLADICDIINKKIDNIRLKYSDGYIEDTQ